MEGRDNFWNTGVVASVAINGTRTDTGIWIRVMDGGVRVNRNSNTKIYTLGIMTRKVKVIPLKGTGTPPGRNNPFAKSIKCLSHSSTTHIKKPRLDVVEPKTVLHNT